MIERFSRCPVVPVFIQLHATTKKFSILETANVDITQFTSKEKRGKKKLPESSANIDCLCCKKKFKDKVALIKHWLEIIQEPSAKEDDSTGEVSMVLEVHPKEEPQEGSSSSAEVTTEVVDTEETALIKVEKNDDLNSSSENLADWGWNDCDDDDDDDDSDDLMPEVLKKKLKKIRTEKAKEAKEKVQAKKIKKEPKESKNKALAVPGEKSVVAADRKDVQLYECEKCKKKFQAKGAVKKHMVKLCYVNLYGGPKIVCQICDQRFIRKSEHKRHMKTIHYKAPSFTCDFCPETFNKKMELKAHIKTHPKPWKCSFCPAAFKRKQHLINHSVKHSDVRPFVCDVCGATFKLKQNLADHKKTHGNNRIYMCHVCSGTFKTVTTLYHHMKTHSDYKPFACETCGFRFKKRHDLKKHMLTHSDIKPFVCDLCGYASKRVSDLNSHKKTVHSIFFSNSRSTQNALNAPPSTQNNSFILGSNNAITAGNAGSVLVVMNNALSQAIVPVASSSVLPEAHSNPLPAHSNPLPEAHSSTHNAQHAHMNTLNDGHNGPHSNEQHNNEQNNVAHNNVFSHIIFGSPYGNFVNQNGKMISL